MKNSMQALVGQSLGKYKIIEQIGEGGMAAVLKGYQTSLNRDVALKVLPPSFARRGNFTERFEREAQAIGNLHHPHILAVYDYGQDRDYSYIVMRYIEHARTLADVMKQPLKTEQIITLVDQIAAALDHAHARGIIHRDIKPSNVLMDGDWPLLSDFGLAKITEDVVDLTDTGGATMGTPTYMSPEQGTGKNVDYRTDIYALGIILYEMLTGSVPHKAETPIAIIMKRLNEPLPLPTSLNPNIPAAVERVLLKALAFEPQQRFDSAGEMAAALKEAFGARPAEVLTDVDQTYVNPPSGEETNLSLAEKTRAGRSVVPESAGGSRFILPVNIFGFSLTYILVGVALLGIAALLALQLWPERSPITWMYVLDLSSQMQEPFPNESVSKWEAARASLSEDLALAPEEINLGLRVFGRGEGDNGCTETELVVEPDPGQVNAIQNSLGGLTPDGSESPLTEAIVQTMNNLELSPDKRNAMVILTSGQDSCEPDAVAQVGTLVQRLNVKVDTYVVGLAIEDPLVEASLQELAAAGEGVYRPANSVEELQEALEDIRENLEDENDPQEIALAPTPTPTPTSMPTPTNTPTATSTPTTTPSPTPTVPKISNMSVPRDHHSVTVLPDGRILVAGGWDDYDSYASIERTDVYNPVTNEWISVGNLNIPRDNHKAILLNNGKVLVAGGDNSGEIYSSFTDSVELYDPNTNQWSLTGAMNVEREDHTLTLLPDGRVLAVGGRDITRFALTSAELYDPETETWSLTGNMNFERWEHTATLLNNNMVLVVGGRDTEGAETKDALTSAELYDVATETWIVTGSLNKSRRDHTATLLLDGRVLVAGGRDENDPLDSAELYDPETGMWSFTGTMNEPHSDHTATLLRNGHVLVVGGKDSDTAELYNPTTGAWTMAGNLSVDRQGHHSVLLDNGSVLVIGGESDELDQFLNVIEMYNPDTGSWVAGTDQPLQLQDASDGEASPSIPTPTPTSSVQLQENFGSN